MSKEKRVTILQAIDSRTKVMALIALIAEALFLGSLATLPADQTLYALIACAVILLVVLVGIVVIEMSELGAKRARPDIAQDAQSDSFPHMPEDIRKELGLPFIVKRDQQSDDQRELLEYIERRTAGGGSVSQRELEDRFAKHTGRYVYWRLEVLRYLGFLDKVDVGEQVGDKPRFSYKLSAEYKKERDSTSA